MRLFGRITAPLMCFFIAEGFRHTHDRKKYLLRMIAFAVISQPFYFIFLNHSLPKNALESFRSMNVIYTLSLGLLTLLIVTHKKLPMVAKAVLTAIIVSVYTAQTAHSARPFCPHSPLLPTVLPIS